jgi:PhnB protein
MIGKLTLALCLIKQINIMLINPYLHFMGNTEEAMNFYKSVLGGEFTIFSRFKDVPGGEKMLAEEQEKIIHVSLTISPETTIMATDALESMDQNLVMGNNFHICLHVKNETEVDRIFDAFAAGGKIEMPVNKTFFGSYFGMCRDKFGVQWMISYTYNKQI